MFLGTVTRQDRIARILPHPSAKAVRAKLIDPRAAEKNEQSLPFFKEPLCDYQVIPYPPAFCQLRGAGQEEIGMKASSHRRRDDGLGGAL